MPSLDQILCPDLMKGPDRNILDDKCDSILSDSNTKHNSRRCNIPDCHKTAKRGGRCISHGGGNKCTIDGCNTSVVSRGLCVTHGGGKRCQTQECTKSAQSGGFCWVHGGGKKCGYDGCSKRAQSGGACIAHGGGKRCRVNRCNKVVQYDGLCVRHGGYRRCTHERCDRRAMANDYCQQHGGSSICKLEHCCKRAVRGGMCSRHKGEASLQAAPSKLSGDEDYDRNLDTLYTPDSPWRTGSDLFVHTKNSPESHTQNTSNQLYDSVKACSSPLIRPSLQHDSTSSVASRASGFLALLSANDQFPRSANGQFSNTTIETSNLNAGSYHQSQNTEHRTPPNVLPVLPSIKALQNFCSKVSDNSPCMALNSPITIHPFRSNQQFLASYQNREKQPLPSNMDIRRGEEFRFHLDSYHQKNNSGILLGSTSLTRRQELGR